LEQLKSKLKLNAGWIQVPIGAEKEFQGVIDLIEMKALYNNGDRGFCRIITSLILLEKTS
jgi:elongation factor G